MRLVALAVPLMIAFVVGCGKPPESAGDDLAALQGAWTVSDIETGDCEDEQFKEVFKNATIRVKEDVVTLTVKRAGGGEKNEYAKITLDAAKSPKELEAVDADEQGKPKPTTKLERNAKTGKIETREGPPDSARAIYKLNGDTLTLAISFDKNGSRPTDFRKKKGSAVVQLMKAQTP